MTDRQTRLLRTPDGAATWSSTWAPTALRRDRSARDPLQNVKSWRRMSRTMPVPLKTPPGKDVIIVGPINVGTEAVLWNLIRVAPETRMVSVAEAVRCVDHTSQIAVVLIDHHGIDPRDVLHAVGHNAGAGLFVVPSPGTDSRVGSDIPHTTVSTLDDLLGCVRRFVAI